MPIKTTLDNVNQTQDGPWTCYDAVVTAREIATLRRTGFIRVDDERQRGRDSVSAKPVIKQEKIERWSQQLIDGDAVLGQLTWNFRPEESHLSFDPANRTLEVAGGATLPDSRHRHDAIVLAVDSAARGSDFDVDRMFSVRIFNVSADDEPRIFYAYNQEGEKADPTRSKWLHPSVATQRFAAELVRRSPHLKDNVDTIRDRMSKRNFWLCAFNTLSKAFEDSWVDVDLGSDDAFEANLEWMLAYWDTLVGVLPELQRLDITRRTLVRETSVADSAIAIHGYINLARHLRAAEAPLTMLERLAEPVKLDGLDVPFFSRQNPEWQTRGVLVSAVKRNGARVLNVRNANQSRRAIAEAMSEKVGLDEGAYGADRLNSREIAMSQPVDAEAVSLPS